MNREAKREMAKDVEENKEMYQALADGTTVKVPVSVLGHGYAKVIVTLDSGTSDLLDEQFVKQKAEEFAQELGEELRDCREARNE
jgi:hypothetical protein